MRSMLDVFVSFFRLKYFIRKILRLLIRSPENIFRLLSCNSFVFLTSVAKHNFASVISSQFILETNQELGCKLGIPLQSYDFRLTFLEFSVSQSTDITIFQTKVLSVQAPFSTLQAYNKEQQLKNYVKGLIRKRYFSMLFSFSTFIDGPS